MQILATIAHITAIHKALAIFANFSLFVKSIFYLFSKILECLRILMIKYTFLENKNLIESRER